MSSNQGNIIVKDTGTGTTKSYPPTSEGYAKAATEIKKITGKGRVAECDSWKRLEQAGHNTD